MVLSPLDNLILVGLRASGKTTLGRELALALERPFVDLDDQLAQLAGCSADEVLSERGEEVFRRLERQALVLVAGLSGRVIATGGGSVLHQAEMGSLAATGCVVYLNVPLDELLKRAQARPRPRLCGGSLREEIVALAAARTSIYEELAQITLSSPDVHSILGELEGWPQRPHG